MRYAVAVLSSGRINPHFGRAKKVALVDVEMGSIKNWQEIETTYAAFHPGHHDHHHHHDHLHDQDDDHDDAHDHAHDNDRGHDHPHDHADDHDHHHQEGHPGRQMDPERARHQEAIRDFLLEHGVDVLLLDHAGPGIARVLSDTHIRVVAGVTGVAKEAVLAADHFVRTQLAEGQDG